ncbi:Protein of unknown function [Gryllus bimaculatus]|nr:Protein of unknown function [Gryllus bimaculatus]
MRDGGHFRPGKRRLRIALPWMQSAAIGLKDVISSTAKPVRRLNGLTKSLFALFTSEIAHVALQNSMACLSLPLAFVRAEPCAGAPVRGAGRPARAMAGRWARMVSGRMAGANGSAGIGRKRVGRRWGAGLMGSGMGRGMGADEGRGRWRGRLGAADGCGAGSDFSSALRLRNDGRGAWSSPPPSAIASGANALLRAGDPLSTAAPIVRFLRPHLASVPRDPSPAFAADSSRCARPAWHRHRHRHRLRQRAPPSPGNRALGQGGGRRARPRALTAPPTLRTTHRRLRHRPSLRPDIGASATLAIATASFRCRLRHRLRLRHRRLRHRLRLRLRRPVAVASTLPSASLRPICPRLRRRLRLRRRPRLRLRRRLRRHQRLYLRPHLEFPPPCRRHQLGCRSWRRLRRVTHTRRQDCGAPLEIFRGHDPSATLPWEHAYEAIHMICTRLSSDYGLDPEDTYRLSLRATAATPAPALPSRQPPHARCCTPARGAASDGGRRSSSAGSAAGGGADLENGGADAEGRCLGGGAADSPTGARRPARPTLSTARSRTNARTDERRAARPRGGRACPSSRREGGRRRKTPPPSPAWLAMASDYQYLGSVRDLRVVASHELSPPPPPHPPTSRLRSSSIISTRTCTRCTIATTHHHHHYEEGGGEEEAAARARDRGRGGGARPRSYISTTPAQHQQHTHHAAPTADRRAAAAKSTARREARPRARRHTHGGGRRTARGSLLPQHAAAGGQLPRGLYTSRRRPAAARTPPPRLPHQVVPGGYTFREDAKDGLEEALPAAFKAQEDDFRRATYAYQNATEEYLRHQSAAGAESPELARNGDSESPALESPKTTITTTTITQRSSTTTITNSTAAAVGGGAAGALAADFAHSSPAAARGQPTGEHSHGSLTQLGSPASGGGGGGGGRRRRWGRAGAAVDGDAAADTQQQQQHHHQQQQQQSGAMYVAQVSQHQVQHQLPLAGLHQAYDQAAGGGTGAAAAAPGVAALLHAGQTSAAGNLSSLITPQPYPENLYESR